MKKTYASHDKLVAEIRSQKADILEMKSSRFMAELSEKKFSISFLRKIADGQAQAIQELLETETNPNRIAALKAEYEKVYLMSSEYKREYLLARLKIDIENLGTDVVRHKPTGNIYAHYHGSFMQLSWSDMSTEIERRAAEIGLHYNTNSEPLIEINSLFLESLNLTV